MKRDYIFTSESVSEGHPDKVCDRISDMVVDSYLSSGDPQTRVACETLTTTNKVVLAGEVRGPSISKDQIISQVRDCIKDIGYEQDGFHWQNCEIDYHLHPQSSDIAMGVDSGSDKEEGAGDQGIMVGYATNETISFMPPTFDISRNIQMALWEIQNNDEKLDLDSKVQVTTGGEETKVVISTQHKKDIDIDELRINLEDMITKYVDGKFQFDLNPSGSFVKGGPAGDTGLTGRKIVVDAYGPTVPVGGGAFSGKDPSKVDRSAAYAARHLAKNIVAHNLADKCQIRVAYAIGKAEPYELSVDTFGSQKEKDSVLNDFVSRFGMKPGVIIERLDLLNVNYREDTLFSHFGHENRNWEKIEDI